MYPCYFYDVPPWIDETRLKEIFQRKSKLVTSAMLLNWIPSDVSMLAWEMIGQDLTSLNGAMIRGRGTARPVYMIT